MRIMRDALVFIVEEKYEENETLIVQSLVKVNLIQ